MCTHAQTQSVSCADGSAVRRHEESARDQLTRLSPVQSAGPVLRFIQSPAQIESSTLRLQAANR
jgi:hypothetical protein